MAEFQRTLLPSLAESVQPGRAAILYGARRVGKTTLLQQLLKNEKRRHVLLAGDDRSTAEIFESQTVARLKSAFSDYALIAIDEAQYEEVLAFLQG